MVVVVVVVVVVVEVVVVIHELQSMPWSANVWPVVTLSISHTMFSMLKPNEPGVGQDTDERKNIKGLFIVKHTT